MQFLSPLHLSFQDGIFVISAKANTLRLNPIHIVVKAAFLDIFLSNSDSALDMHFNLIS